MKLFRHIKDAIRLTQLPSENRRLVFYSEGKAYWPHLQGILHELLNQVDFPICYLSSNENDPGLTLDHPKLLKFKTDEGWVRNWLFENINTEMMVMTMPDLHQYQVKRSKHKVHYVYVHHSLVSSHMVYREGAFDHFDTIFCAGPHHVQEIRALEQANYSRAKNLVYHGYGRLDSILTSRDHTLAAAAKSSRTKILIAPSWGPYALIELTGDEIIEPLIKAGYHVTLRPHPQTVKFAKDKIDSIQKKYQDNDHFVLELDVSSQDSLHHSDLMISDWSGAALDYAFGLEKPVLFIDVPRKVNNPGYQSVAIKPFEVMIREKIGVVVPQQEIKQVVDYVESLLKKEDWSKKLAELRNQHVFNPLQSASVGARYITEVLTHGNN